MSKNELPESGDWESVEAAVRQRMQTLDMSTARLSRESGVSESTIRYIGQPAKRQRSTLVALSAALGWRHDYLADLLRDTADQPESPGLATGHPMFITDVMTAIGALEVKVDDLEELLFAVTGKLDMLMTAARSRASR